MSFAFNVFAEIEFGVSEEPEPLPVGETTWSSACSRSSSWNNQAIGDSTWDNQTKQHSTWAKQSPGNTVNRGCN